VSFILKKRYDVTVLNTALPDFPYCEYITERGGLCAFLDGETVLPFAKFSFDAIHHSWVYHGATPARWREVLLEQNRILRPGGYLWIRDGLSYAQLKTIKYLLLHQLGYKVLFENEIKRKSITVYFASNPYEKCHKKEYKRLIEERKSSLGVLHKVIQELSDDTDNEEDNDYQTETISRNTLNIDRSVRATTDDESSMKKNSI
ncbi:unnamed protein product, partial [Rotaria magnacalcarata]